MGLFDGFKKKRAARAAARAVASGDVEAGFAAARALGTWVPFVEELTQLRREADLPRALIEAAATDSRGALVLQAVEVAARLEAAEAEALLTPYVDALPEHEGLVNGLARARLQGDNAAGAAKLLEPLRASAGPEALVTLGEALFELDRIDDALEILGPVVEWYESTARNSMFTGGVDSNDYAEALRLYEAVLAHRDGAEAVTVDAARRHQLMPGSGRNLRLLSDAAKVKAPRLAPVLKLQTVGATRALAAELLARQPAVAHTQLGMAALREGDAKEAREEFEKALAVDASHFGAQAGLGAATEMIQDGWLAQVVRLPDREPPKGLPDVAPDWSVLTRYERRVVAASAAPLARWLGALAASGRKIVVLPTDVRVIDLPEFEGLELEKFEDDHRSFAAMSGLADGELAVAAVDTLLHMDVEGWTFAHELAHLVELVLPDSELERLEELYEQACDESWAFGHYQLSNVHEFFAVSYVEWLVAKYGFGEPVSDEARALHAPLERWLSEIAPFAAVT